LRNWLGLVWAEIRELPENQRAALLLNLRSVHGAAVALIADLGLATFSEIATALGMNVQALAELWNRLPLEDREIAERLGLERQQVINLRSAARQRLERRVRLGANIRKN